MAALAAQARIGVGKEVSRYQGGLVGKLWIDKAKLLFLGEANFIRQQVSAAYYGQNQFVSYLGATVFPIRGLMPAVAYERFQENLAVKGTGRNSFLGQLNVFPYAHCELVFLFRYLIVGTPASPPRRWACCSCTTTCEATSCRKPCSRLSSRSRPPCRRLALGLQPRGAGHRRRTRRT